MNSLFLTALSSLLVLVPQDDSAAERRARRLVDSGRHGAAIEKLEELLAEDPANGWAWYQLASSHHSLGQYAEAARANRRASEFPGYRPTGLYNLACAQSLAGDLEGAAESLEAAQAAGFLDFDLMLSDSDLVPMRAKYPIEVPPALEYSEIMARGRIPMRYALLEPKGFDRERSYPVLAVFPPGGGTVSADWIRAELFADVSEQERWVVLVLVAPAKRGWWTHPSHHALEDLLKRIRKEIHVEGDRFHLFALGSGCSPASSYAHMSKKFFQSMTVVSNSHWASYDRSDLERWPLALHHIVGELDTQALELAERTQAVFVKAGRSAKLTVIEGQDALVPTLRGTRFWDLLPR